MHLAQIKVTNFRNLSDFTLTLRPGLNVILGENNSGKTNLMDALRIAVGPAGSTTELPRLSQDDLSRSFETAPEPSSFTVRLTLEDMDLDQQAQFIDALNFNPAEPLKSTATINFEWTWNKTRGFVRRWGREGQSDSAVQDDTLSSIPIYFLEALRDAERALSPGRQSRLVRLLASLGSDAQKQALTQIGSEANKLLQADDLVVSAQDKIEDVLVAASGPNLSQDTVVRASEPRFEGVASSLRLVLKSRQLNSDGASPEEEVTLNGLGYNNLLFIAATLAELTTWEHTSLPVLLVEEPEAHLHPQLQTLLADFLAKQSDQAQVIVTTHSPTIAAHVDPRTITLVRSERRRAVVRPLIHLADEVSPRELGHIRRMLDVSRASMLFARGVILVEGPSEAIITTLGRSSPLPGRRHLPSLHSQPQYGLRL